MIIHYLKKDKKKRRKHKCRVCKSRIMWTVNCIGKNMPIEYDEELEYLFDGVSKVYFESSIMKPHFPNCPARKIHK